MRMATIFSKAVTNNMLRAIYGERQVGLYMSALIQAGDILMPQLPEFGGPKPVIVPVGADQDPHIRLSRDLANAYHQEFGFVPPSAIYHRLIRSLDGSTKMSKRSASSSFTLDDDPSVAAKKVMAGFTGGRATIEEQRRIGAEADKCPIYDLYLFHFAVEDEYAKRVRDECYGGIRMCGDCKKELAVIVKKYLEEHAEEAPVLHEGRGGTDGEEQEDPGLDGEMSEAESAPLHPLEQKVLTALKGRDWTSFDSVVSGSGLLPDQVRRSVSWLASKKLISESETTSRRVVILGDPAELLLIQRIGTGLPMEELATRLQVESGVRRRAW